MIEFNFKELIILYRHMVRGANWKNEISKEDDDLMQKLECMLGDHNYKKDNICHRCGHGTGVRNE